MSGLNVYVSAEYIGELEHQLAECREQNQKLWAEVHSWKTSAEVHHNFAEGLEQELIKCEQERDRLREDLHKLRAAMEGIERWSRAYPTDIFIEPDLAKAHSLLQAGGMTLDSISASAIRHVVKGVGDIAEQALKGE